MSAHVKDSIAERELLVMGQPERKVTVTFGRPELAPDMPDVWRCLFSIVGLDEPCDLETRAEDSVAALLIAFKVARDRLDGSGLRWAWTDGKEREQPLDIIVPLYLLPEQVRAIERCVRAQEADFARRARARARAMGHTLGDPDE